MRKILCIALGNMRKSKVTVVALVGMVTLMTILFCSCFSTLLDVNGFVNRKHQELNGSNFFTMGSEKYRDKMIQALEKTEGFKEQETEGALRYQNASYKNQKVETEPQHIAGLVLNYDNTRSIGLVNVIDKGKEIKKNSVILPYVLKSASGYRTGDDIIFDNGTHEYKLNIYGFYEDIFFATPTSMVTYKIYVPNAQYNEMYNQSTEFEKIFHTNVMLKPGVDEDKFENDYGDQVSSDVKEKDLWYMSVGSGMMKVATIAFVEIMVSIMLGLSLIFLIIVMVVIRFSIITHIERNMSNIGMLKASGFTSGQVRRSLGVEFLIITTIGWILGICISQLTTPIIGNLVSSAMGLKWTGSFSVKGLVVSFLVIYFIVFLTIMWTTRRLKKITPLVALRKGIENNHFKRNWMPLESTKGMPSVVLGLKSMFHNGKQNRVLSILTLVFSFACVFSFVAYYNLVEDNTAFLELVGMETEDILVTIPEDYEEVVSELKKYPEIDFVMAEKGYALRAEKKGKSIGVSSSGFENFEKVRNIKIRDGRIPQNENEIVVTNLVAEKLDVKLGDMIQIIYNSKKHDFIIVGMTQQISMMGRWVGFTEEGIKRMDPTMERHDAYVYLKDPNTINDVIKKISNQFRKDGVLVENWQISLLTAFESYSKAMELMCVGCIAVTILIVVLVMYLLLKVKIIKDRQQYGVWKALGFTTKQLVLQEVISIILPLLLGGVVGSFVAYFGANTIMALALSSFGICQVEFVTCWYFCVCTFVGIMLLGIVTAAVVSMRVRKIQPAVMIQEE